MTNVDIYDPATWGFYRPSFIVHDVGIRRNSSTAVVGGFCPNSRLDLIGIGDIVEFPIGQTSHQRLSTLAGIDLQHSRNSMIIADVSNEQAYAELLHQSFGPRLIGVHIGRSGDGMQVQLRPSPLGMMPVYPIGRTYLIEQFSTHVEAGRVCFADYQQGQRAFQQLANLAVEARESGRVYTCAPGQHDDLGISCALLVWAAKHPQLQGWISAAVPRPPVVNKPISGVF